MKKLLGIFFLFAITDSVAQYAEEELVKKFNDYNRVWQKKKLHLIFNQDKFSPGDTVYFKSYFLSEDLSGIPGNQVIDLHLVNDQGNSVLQLKFSVANGIGRNQFVIPPTLAQGFYVVVAYSSWMLNFDPSFFFKKTISIVDRNAIVQQQRHDLKVAVEGNRMVAGIKNKVVVSSSPISLVLIINSNGEDIGHTLTDSTGMGAITFIPRQTDIYYAQTIGDENKLALPASQKDGLVTSLVSTSTETIRFSVATPTGSNLRKKEFIAIVTSRGRVSYSAAFSMGAGQELSIPRASLSEGINHLSLLDPAGNLFASRDFYAPAIKPINATINVDKKTFQAREKVKLEIEITDNLGRPMEGEFLVKATASNLLGSQKQNSINDEFFVQSYIREPYFIDRSDSTWVTRLNDFLVLNTEGIPWNEVLANKVKKPIHSLSNFIQMKGHVSLVDTSSRKLPDFLDILFYLQRSHIKYQTAVENGNVWLALPELFGEDELFYQAETFYYVNDQQHGEEVSGLKINWEIATPKLPKAPTFKEHERMDPYASFTTKNKLIARSFGFYSAKASPQPTSILEQDLIPADVVINVQEYTLFPTMADMIKEIIPFLQHRKINHRDRVLVALNEDLALLSTGDPVYIIDGTATKSTDFFLSLKPKDLLTVKVVINSQKLKRFGLMGKNGMVIVNTKKGDAREPVDRSKLIQGLSRPIDFKVHSYDGPFNHMPDFRSTVFWNPSIKTNNGKSTVEFYASDNLGPLSVRVEGISVEGIPFSKELQLEVVNEDLKK